MQPVTHPQCIAQSAPALIASCFKILAAGMRMLKILIGSITARFLKISTLAGCTPILLSSVTRASFVIDNII